MKKSLLNFLNQIKMSSGGIRTEIREVNFSLFLTTTQMRTRKNFSTQTGYSRLKTKFGLSIRRKDLLLKLLTPGIRQSHYRNGSKTKKVLLVELLFKMVQMVGISIPTKLTLTIHHLRNGII
jgi:hypothetical protein